MSYTPFVFFGYEIQLPPDMDLCRSIPMMYDLNGMIRSPFEIKSILSTFYPLMNEEEYARVVIGFIPEEIRDTIDLSNELAEFVQDNPLFDGLEIANVPLFHCGIEWCPEIDLSETTSESDLESDSESTSESDVA
jgi:hypothetical protein